jgi:hypothetical protein
VLLLEDEVSLLLLAGLAAGVGALDELSDDPELDEESDEELDEESDEELDSELDEESDEELDSEAFPELSSFLVDE